LAPTGSAAPLGGAAAQADNMIQAATAPRRPTMQNAFIKRM
jgi:hypothetical protein